MSSKRKSPPTKLQEGVPNEDHALPPTLVGGGSDGGGLTDLEETSSNNLSDEEGTPGNLQSTTELVPPSGGFYKLSDTSSPSLSNSEVEENEINDPPVKKARLLEDVGDINDTNKKNRGLEDLGGCQDDVTLRKQRILEELSIIIDPVKKQILLNELISLENQRKSNFLLDFNPHALNLHFNEALKESNRRRNSSECSSPTSEYKGLHNNNNSMLFNNNSGHGKRTMDDVLKRLTSKMNNSTIREEKRPTPSTTPNTKNQ